MQKPPYISVVICTYCRDKYLKYCLNELGKQSYPADGYELLIIDNAGRRETHSIVRQLMLDKPNLNIRYIIESNVGLSNARNRGIEESKGDIIIFMDDDVIPPFTIIEEYAKAFSEWPEVWAIAGKIDLFWEGGRPDNYPTEWEMLLSKLDLGDDPRDIMPPDETMIGANMAFRKIVFSKIDKFNINLGFTGNDKVGGEELEICQRIYYAGGIIRYLPAVAILHIVTRSQLSINAIRKRAFGMGKERVFREILFISGREKVSPSSVTGEVRWLMKNYKYMLKRILRNKINVDEEISYYKHLGVFIQRIYNILTLS